MVDKSLALGAIFGAVFLILGLNVINATVFWLGGSLETTATVVDYYNPQHIVYYPIFEFKDAAGSTITVQSIEGGTVQEFKIGEKVKILYNSINPVENVRIKNFFYI